MCVRAWPLTHKPDTGERRISYKNMTCEVSLKSIKPVMSVKILVSGTLLKVYELEQ